MRWSLIALAVTLGLLLSAASASADSLATRPVTFPHTLHYGAAAAAPNGNIYIFGGVERCVVGDCVTLDKIWRYTPPPTESLTLLSETLPIGKHTFAVEAAGQIYLVGGFSTTGSGYLTNVQRFDPSTEQIHAHGTLGSPQHGPALAFDGVDTIYVMGGESGGTRTDRITAYSISTGTSTDTGHTLPSAREGGTGFWRDGKAYVVGGVDAAGAATDSVIAYDPSTGAASIVVHLGNLRSYAGGADTGDVYLALGPSDVDSFDPTTQTGASTGLSFSPSVRAPGAAWHSDTNSAYVFGGVGLDTIQQYSVSSAAPPVPELPTLVLSALGLVLVMGLAWTRARR